MEKETAYARPASVAVRVSPTPVLAASFTPSKDHETGEQYSGEGSSVGLWDDVKSADGGL